MTIEFHPVASPPKVDKWVLAFWRHMSPKYQHHGKKISACGGWFPTRYRRNRWQAQFLSHRCYPLGTPELWTPILEPEEVKTDTVEHSWLERLMDVRFGGCVLRCPSCKKVGEFRKLRKRRVYACPECRFQIAPTANTALHDTRTPLAKWFEAEELLSANPKMTGRELSEKLGVTYKTAWHMGRRIRAARAIEAQRAETGTGSVGDESAVA